MVACESMIGNESAGGRKFSCLLNSGARCLIVAKADLVISSLGKCGMYFCRWHRFRNELTPRHKNK